MDIRVIFVSVGGSYDRETTYAMMQQLANLRCKFIVWRSPSSIVNEVCGEFLRLHSRRVIDLEMGDELKGRGRESKSRFASRVMTVASWFNVELPPDHVMIVFSHPSMINALMSYLQTGRKRDILHPFFNIPEYSLHWFVKTTGIDKSIRAYHRS